MSRGLVNLGTAFIGVSVVLSAAAQLLMRAGMLDVQLAGLAGGEWDMNHFRAWLPALGWVVAGLVCYGLSMLSWMGALARHELSLAYPVLSLSYVLVYAGAVAWPRLGESVSFYKTLGIAVIVLGVVLVTWSGRGAGESREDVTG